MRRKSFFDENPSTICIGFNGRDEPYDHVIDGPEFVLQTAAAFHARDAFNLNGSTAEFGWAASYNHAEGLWKEAVKRYD